MCPCVSLGVFVGAFIHVSICGSVCMCVLVSRLAHVFVCISVPPWCLCVSLCACTVQSMLSTVMPSCFYTLKLASVIAMLGSLCV